MQDSRRQHFPLLYHPTHISARPAFVCTPPVPVLPKLFVHVRRLEQCCGDKLQSALNSKSQ
jgi:hypothetical protein